MPPLGKRFGGATASPPLFRLSSELAAGALEPHLMGAYSVNMARKRSLVNLILGKGDGLGYQ